MTAFHLSDDERFAVSLAVGWLGVWNKDAISGELCERIAGSILAYLSEENDRTTPLEQGKRCTNPTFRIRS